MPLQVAVEREVIYRQLDMERQRIYERSIRDPLTGLFTRIYMQEVVQRLFDIQDRSPGNWLAVLMLDIDHFKQINDSYGHNQGDVVLRRVAAEILDTARGSDIPVRLGGEEFAIFVVGDAVSQNHPVLRTAAGADRGRSASTRPCRTNRNRQHRRCCSPTSGNPAGFDSTRRHCPV